MPQVQDVHLDITIQPEHVLLAQPEPLLVPEPPLLVELHSIAQQLMSVLPAQLEPLNVHLPQLPLLV